MDTTPAMASEGVARIAAERARQISAEGYTPAHDLEHSGFELSQAAQCYLDCATALGRGASLKEFQSAADGYCVYVDGTSGGPYWPWEEESLRLTADPLRNLEKAGGLIAAEIDRFVAAARANGQVIEVKSHG